MDFPDSSAGEESAFSKMKFRSLGQEDALKEEMATHSSILA